MRRLSNFVIKYSLYGLVFLMPLFWLSFTFEGFEFNKQYLLFILTAAALLAWLLKMVVVQKRLTFKRTPLDFLILALMLVLILSAVFSVDGFSSWLGFYGRFTDSAATFLTLLVMYFVVVNNIRIRSQRTVLWLKPENSSLDTPAKDKAPITIRGILNWFLVSVGLTVLAAYFSIFNLWTKLPWLGERLPGLMGQRSFNPISGSLEGLAVFLVAAVSLLTGIILNRIKKQEPGIKGRISFFYYLSLILALIFLLFIIDFWAAWFSFGLTMFFLLIIAFLTRTFKERVNLLLLPIVLLVISAAGFFGIITKAKEQISFFREKPLPQEVVLDYETAALTTFETVKEFPILGSGPGTFLYGFSKFKPEGFNDNRFWNIRFDKAPSHLMELAGTTGILGILSYLAVAIIFLLVMGMSLLAKRSNPEEDSFSTGLPRDSRPQRFTLRNGRVASRHDALLPLIFLWLSLFISQFVYLENTALNFSFWFFTALSIGVWRQNFGVSRSKISFSFKKWPEIGLVLSTVLLILFFVVLGLFYLGGRFYAADVYYRKGLNQNDLDNRIPNFEKAVNLNRYRINYRFSLSQVYLFGAWREARKPEAERDIQLLQNYAAGAVEQARQAVEISPKLVMSRENLGAIYRDLNALVSGVASFALDSFKEAVALEPTNPFFYRELCRLDLMIEGEIGDETLNQCQKAVDLKPNYLDAHIQLALVYERKGSLEDAVRRLEGALDKIKGVPFERGSDLAGAATEIYFQMGRLHFNLNNFDEAIRFFEQSVIITPNHSNGRYGLAVTYQLKGRNQEALQQFEIVAQLNPRNEVVAAKVRELRGE